jgi:hypothetical protein
MSDDKGLTIEKLQQMMRETGIDFPPRGRDTLLPFPMRPSFAGLDVIVDKGPGPKIQVRQIYLKDGTPLLSKAFLAEQNAKWIASHGYREDLFKEHMYILGGRTLVCSPSQYHSIVNLSGP